MLIITRKPGEAFVIGENVTVTVLGMHGRQVRIGIDAPKDVTIRREELEPRPAPDGFKAQMMRLVGWSFELFA